MLVSRSTMGIDSPLSIILPSSVIGYEQLIKLAPQPIAYLKRRRIYTNWAPQVPLSAPPTSALPSNYWPHGNITELLKDIIS